MKSLFTALLLATFTASASALSCYTCTLGAPATPTNTRACDDPFDRNTTDGYVIKLSCAEIAKLAPPSSQGLFKYDTCAKTTATINGVWTVGRTCFDSSECPSRNGCVSRSGATVCCCNSNFCNGATLISVSVMSTIAMIFAALFLTA